MSVAVGATVVMATALVARGAERKTRDTILAGTTVAAARPDPVVAARGERLPGAVRSQVMDNVAAALPVGGGSVRAVRFLRAPLEYRRISSTFGMRQHPILGIWKLHTGTDYAAPAGTAVRAIGAGVVAFAGRRGGYGNVLEVRHANGYLSRYGHLQEFARGVHTGTAVAIGQTIGFVGMTGLATGPHLHFEMVRGGAQRDPRTALPRDAAAPPPDREHAMFTAFLDHLLGPGRGATVAARHMPEAAGE